MALFKHQRWLPAGIPYPGQTSFARGCGGGSPEALLWGGRKLAEVCPGVGTSVMVTCDLEKFKEVIQHSLPNLWEAHSEDGEIEKKWKRWKVSPKVLEEGQMDLKDFTVNLGTPDAEDWVPAICLGDGAGRQFSNCKKVRTLPAARLFVAHAWSSPS